MEDFTDDIKMHVAGATVRHETPFEKLLALKNDSDLSREFINYWVSPYYMNIGGTDEAWVKRLADLKDELTDDVILKCLGDFNWRTRQTGAYFAGLINNPKFIDAIGVHLLKSEVCYAGSVYCWVLAFFNTPACIEYLNKYLDYYLKQKDLWFDQAHAMEAILYTDKINGTNYYDVHKNNWFEFISNKPYWNSLISTENISRQIALLKKVANKA